MMMKNMFKWMVVGLLIAGTASAAYTNLVPTTTYTNTLGGALIDVVYDTDKTAVPRNLGTILSTNSDSWSSGLPSYTNPGLFDGSVGDGTAGLSTYSGVWYGVAVRQTGGTLSSVNFGMRGGVETSGTVAGFNILEIDDTSNTDFATTNLAVSANLTMWPQAGGSNTLSVLNGYADVDNMSATASHRATVNILNGRLDLGFFENAKVTVNMLAGGTGEFNLADMYGTDPDPAHKSKLFNMILNFETGSEASFTIASSNGVSAVGAWETKIANSQVKIAGSAVTDLSAFAIEDVGALGTKISLAPPAPLPPVPDYTTLV
jgi:hypothetical protein